MEDIQLNDTQLSILSYFNNPSQMINNQSFFLINRVITPLQLLLKTLPKLKECEDLKADIRYLEDNGLLDKDILNLQMTFNGATTPRITNKGKEMLEKLINRHYLKEGK